MRTIVIAGAALSLGFLPLAACSSDVTPASSGTTTSSSSSTSSSSGTGGSAPTCDTAPPPASADWCTRITGASPGKGPVALDLSNAHAEIRFFSPVKAYSDADQALAAALEGATPDLDLYAKGLSPVACALPEAKVVPAAPAKVEPGPSGVAIITPGTGPVALFEGATGVVVDLRNLPTDIDLRPILEAAVKPALGAPVTRPKRSVRHHDGMVDEIFSATNTYTQKIAKLNQEPIPAAGGTGLPLILLTAADMAPEAVELAGALRIAGVAYLYGEDLRTEVAESRLLGVGNRALAYRAFDLFDGAHRWPDTIPADKRGLPADCLLDQGPLPKDAPPLLTFGAANRPKITTTKPFGDKQPPDITPGAARAALYTSHGGVTLFMPDYISFPTPPPDFDGRFLAVLPELDKAALTRQDTLDALHELGVVLNDGHQFVFDYGTQHAGYFVVMIEDIDGQPVVRRSATPDVLPGDRITSIGGVPAADWYAKELARTSAGTDGYRFNLATRRYTTMDGPVEFGLVDPDGVAKKVMVTPQPVAAYQAFGFAPVLRPAGFLTDLGAPAIYYINLSSEALSDIQAFRDALVVAAPATGLVLDMRGYPGINHYEVAQRIIDKPFSSPHFTVPALDGPGKRTLTDDTLKLMPSKSPSFGGKVVLLVGHETVSAAENLSIMLVDAGRVTVVGRNSAGTNGNITGMQLPGDFAFSFTGMNVQHADGSPFLGIGIVPDVEVPLTAAAFRDGVDQELMAAIDALTP
ncbi:MAG: S41 family peptidase [Byssovorax sp.]